MADRPSGGAAPTMPPAWFVHLAWRVHRLLHRVSGGPFLWTPEHKRGRGALVLTTTGWRTGQEHSVIVGYLEEGQDLALLDGEAPRPVVAHEVVGDERAPLWQRWAEVDRDLDGYAARRTTVTPVVVRSPA